LKLNNELDVSVWWHSRQITRKDIGILTDYRNIFYFNICDSIGIRVKILLLRQIEGGGSLIW
jgi:hypothetical protein